MNMEQRIQFENLGFLHLPGYIPPELVRRLGRAFDGAAERYRGDWQKAIAGGGADPRFCDIPDILDVDDAFIDVVETTNLAGELGRWVIETGCRQLTAWHQRFPSSEPLGLSVNVSPAELITRDFVQIVARILHDVGLDGGHLTLEITEKAIVRDTEQALATLRGLKEIGVKVAIDDFGTGYSSLAQLKSLPVDVLKIDRGFIRDLGSNTEDLAIVRSIVGLAGSFGLSTVAEGVETEIAAATLVALGCERAQGFLYAKPCGVSELESYLELKPFTLSHRGKK